MNVTILSHTNSDGANYFYLDAEGQEVRVTVYDDGRCNVCVVNAMSRAYNRGFGMGRVFDTEALAMEAYKSAKVRTAIALAYEVAPDFNKTSDQ